MDMKYGDLRIKIESDDYGYIRIDIAHKIGHPGDPENIADFITHSLMFDHTTAEDDFIDWLNVELLDSDGNEIYTREFERGPCECHFCGGRGAPA